MSARYEIKHFLYFYLSFRTFFHGLGFFRIGSGFLADPDPVSEKILILIREKTRIRNTGLNLSQINLEISVAEPKLAAAEYLTRLLQND